MPLVAGAICFDGSWSAQKAGGSLAEGAARYPTLAVNPLFADERVALYSVERPEHEPRKVAARFEDGREFWIVGDVNYAVDRVVSRVQRELESKREVPGGLPGRWLGIEYSHQSHRVRIHTDRLGIGWLYLARVPGGWLFCSDFGALIGGLDHAPGVDYEVCLSELALGYAFDDRTVFEGVTLAPAGASFDLGETGLENVTKRRIEYGDALVGKTDAEKFEILDGLWDVTVERYFKSYSHPIISISGGFDSRHALAFFHKFGLEARYFTFGDPASEEVAKARSHCAKCGVTTQVYHFEQSNWDDWREAIQQVGNTGVVQWVGWARAWHEQLYQNGSSLVTGIFGGPWTGTHLGSSEPADGDWINRWVEWGAGDWLNSPLLRPEARQWMESSVRAGLEKAVSEATVAFPHQQAVHLDIYGRQRRWTAVQPALISRFLTPIPYLYSDEMMDFFTNLPFEDLCRQRLYLAYARSRFPDLFPPEAPAPSLLSRGVRKVGRITKAMISGGPEQQPARVIDHARMIEPNRDRIVELARRFAHIIDSIIDVERFCEGVGAFGSANTISSYEIIRCVNLFWLLALQEDHRVLEPAVSAPSSA